MVYKQYLCRLGTFFERAPALFYGHFALIAVFFYLSVPSLLWVPCALYLLVLLVALPQKRVAAFCTFSFFLAATSFQIIFPRTPLNDKGVLTFQIIESLPGKNLQKQRFKVKVVRFVSNTVGKEILKGTQGVLRVNRSTSLRYYTTYQALTTLYTKGDGFSFFTLSGAPHEVAQPALFDVLHERSLHYFLMRSACLLQPSMERGILESMTLGVKIDKTTRRMLNKLGLDHMVVVSGFHLGLLATSLYLILSLFLSISFVRVITLVFVVGYILVIGLQPSLLRAGIGSLLFLLAPFFWRRGNGCNSVGVALLLFLLFDPTIIFSIGFQLSFAATLGILLWLRPLQDWLQVSDLPKNLVELLLKPASITVSALLLLLPLLFVYFGGVSCWGLFANILLPPIMSIATGIYLTALVLFPISILGSSFEFGLDVVLAKVAYWLTHALYLFIERLDELPSWQLEMYCTPLLGGTVLIGLVITGCIALEGHVTRLQHVP